MGHITIAGEKKITTEPKVKECTNMDYIAAIIRMVSEVKDESVLKTVYYILLTHIADSHK